MSNVSKLPELHQGYMDSLKLTQYRDDLENLTKIQEIIIKHKPLQMINTKVHNLDSSFELLVGRAVMGLQIRYHWNMHNWCDTLVWRNERISLIRICCDH